VSAVGLEGLEHTVQLTHVWINDLNDRLAWNNKSRSYRLLKAVLHALRDRLTVNDSAHLAAQLPGLLRGAYYEQWRPADTPSKRRTAKEFLEDVSASFANDMPERLDAAVMQAFKLLTTHVTAGEVAKVRHALPEEIRNMWPEPYTEPGTVKR
jgi:uncharacterized protein (DUF2267 family)